MEIECDPVKDEANRAKHGLSLARAADLDFAAAVVIADRRFDYGESRSIAYAPLRGPPCLWYTLRGDRIRVIGLRKANERARARHDGRP